MISRTFQGWVGGKFKVLPCAESVPDDIYAIYREGEDEPNVWKRVPFLPKFTDEAKAEAYLKKLATKKSMKEVRK